MRGESYYDSVPSRIRPPPLLPSYGEGKGERREREKERGGRAPTPCPIRFGQGGGARHLVALLPSLH